MIELMIEQIDLAATISVWERTIATFSFREYNNEIRSHIYFCLNIKVLKTKKCYVPRTGAPSIISYFAIVSLSL